MEVEGSNLPEPVELVYQNYISFYGNNNGTLIIENKFESDFENSNITETLDFKLLWQKPMRDEFRIKILNSLKNKEHFWSHEESIGFNLQYPLKSNDELENPIFLLNLKHLSKITVTSLGALKTWIKVGFLSENQYFTAGFEAGIEIEISF